MKIELQNMPLNPNQPLIINEGIAQPENQQAQSISSLF